MRSKLPAFLTVCLVVCGSAAAADMNFPAQALGESLRALGNQTKTNLLFDPQTVRNLKAPAVSNASDVAQALSQMLVGTGLTYRFIDARTVTLVPVDAKKLPANASGAANLSAAEGLRFARAETAQPEGAAAQTVPAGQSSSTGESSEDTKEVVVTGSRVRTSKSASNVIVLTSDELKKQGLNTVEDIIRFLPQNYSTINAASALDNSINTVDARGQSAADLRGLGPENTLVLVNGRRRAVTSTFSNGIVNLNTIPAGAIERVEVMLDGASAVYGSDAMAGVINFILKKDYQGAETRVRQETGSNGGDEFTVGQLLGKSWESGNLTLTGQYAKSGSVNARKAGFTTLDYRSLGGDDKRVDYLGTTGVLMNPSTFAPIGSIPATDDGTSGVAGKIALANIVPYDTAVVAPDATSETKRLTFSLSIEQKLTSRITAYGEMNYAKNDSESMQGPPLSFTVMVPTTNRFNNLGQTVFVDYVFLNEWRRGLIAPNSFTSNQKALGATVGTKVSLPHDWMLDLSASRSSEDAFFVGTGLNETLLAQRAAGIDANGAPLPADQHLNLFGNGSAQTAAAMAGLLSPDGFDAAATNKSRTDTALLSAEGVVMRLPAGDMRLATGLEGRGEELKYANRSFIDSTPSRDVRAVFAEIAIPLIGERSQIPWVHSLDIFAAGRREEISIEGPFDGPTNPSRKLSFRRTSPKYGVSWQLQPGLKVRATLSGSFRAPGLSPLFGSTSGPYNFLPLVDPVNPGLGTIFPNVYFASNPRVGPETSDNFSIGADWKASGRLKGLSLSATYSDIDYKDRIESVTLLAFSNPSLLFQLPGLVTRDANNRIARIDLMSINLASRKSETVDVTGTYDIDVHGGSLTFGITGTQVMKLEDVVLPGSAPVELAGTQDGPEKLKWRGWVSWARGDYGINMYANHSSSYTNTNGANFQPQRVDSYLTFDVTGFYRMEAKGWQFNAGVRNLFDADFPFFNGFDRPWDPRRVDTRGRTLYLEVSKRYSLFR